MWPVATGTVADGVLVTFYHLKKWINQVVLNALAVGADEAAANRVFAVAEGTPPSVATDVVVLCN